MNFRPAWSLVSFRLTRPPYIVKLCLPPPKKKEGKKEKMGLQYLLISFCHFLPHERNLQLVGMKLGEQKLFFNIKFIVHMYKRQARMHVGTHMNAAESGNQRTLYLESVFFPPCGYRRGKSVVLHLYPLNHLPGPFLCFEIRSFVTQANLRTSGCPASASECCHCRCE